MPREDSPEEIEQKVENIKRRYQEGEISEGKMEFELEQALGHDVDTSVSHDEIVEYEERTGEAHPVFHVDHKPTRDR